ncbi:hypothetical protein ACQJBY_066695 [Aegilops geniculata]
MACLTSVSCLVSLPSKQQALCRFHWPLPGEVASLTTVPHTISPGVSRRIEHRLPAARGVHCNRIRRREASAAIARRRLPR